MTLKSGLYHAWKKLLISFCIAQHKCDGGVDSIKTEGFARRCREEIEEREQGKQSIRKEKHTRKHSKGKHHFSKMVFKSLTSLSQSIKSRQHTDDEHSNINKNTGRQNRKKTKKKQTEN